MLGVLELKFLIFLSSTSWLGSRETELLLLLSIECISGVGLIVTCFPVPPQLEEASSWPVLSWMPLASCQLRLGQTSLCRCWKRQVRFILVWPSEQEEEEEEFPDMPTPPQILCSKRHCILPSIIRRSPWFKSIVYSSFGSSDCFYESQTCD